MPKHTLPKTRLRMKEGVMDWWLLAAFVFVALVLLTVALAARPAHYSSAMISGDITTLDTTYYSQDGTALTLPGALPAIGGEGAVSFALPAALPRDAALIVYTGHAGLEAYLGNDVIFSWKPAREDAFRAPYGLAWYIVPLPDAAAGRTLTLRLYALNPADEPHLGEILLGESAALTRAIVRENSLPALLSVVMLLIALLLFIMAFVLLLKAPSTEFRSVLFLAIFVLLSALWILLDSDLLLLLSNHLPLLYQASFYTFMLLPVSFVLYMRQRVLKGRTVMLALSALGLLLCVLNATLMLTGALRLQGSLRFTHVYVALCAACALYFLIMETIRDHNRRLYPMALAVACLCVVCAFSLLQYYLVKVADNSAMFRMGLFLFVCILGSSALGQALSIFRSTHDLQTRAESDSLTGLLNHAAAFRRIEEYLTSEGRRGLHALLILDVNQFKLINDRFGHYEGDAALSRLANELRAEFRESDVLGRLGGDEFIVLMKNVPSREAAEGKFADLYKALCYELSMHGAESLTVTCSLGWTLCEGGTKPFDTLYREADAALYRAKEMPGHLACYQTL